MKIQNLVSSLANSKFVKKHIEKSSNNSGYLARTLLLTSVSKDVFAYGLRVRNTLKNDEIPEDKKKFTAEMDAASGVATALTQIGTGFLVSSKKFQDALSSKLLKSLEKNSKEYANAKSALNAISTLVLASILAKRILTPLIASKIAEKDKPDTPDMAKFG